MWLAQGYGIFFGLAGMWGLLQAMRSLHASGGDILWGATVTLVSLATVLGIERRSSWARWLSGGQITLLFIGFALKDVGRYMVSERIPFDQGQLIGGLLVSSLVLLFAWRVVFGESSRAYFAGKPVAPARSFEESSQG